MAVRRVCYNSQPPIFALKIHHLFVPTVALDNTNRGTWQHQPWHLITPTVALDNTNRGTWQHQPWHLMAPTVALEGTNRGT